METFQVWLGGMIWQFPQNLIFQGKWRIREPFQHNCIFDRSSAQGCEGSGRGTAKAVADSITQFPIHRGGPSWFLFVCLYCFFNFPIHWGGPNLKVTDNHVDFFHLQRKQGLDTIKNEANVTGRRKSGGRLFSRRNWGEGRVFPPAPACICSSHSWTGKSNRSFQEMQLEYKIPNCNVLILILLKGGWPSPGGVASRPWRLDPWPVSPPTWFLFPFSAP